MNRLEIDARYWPATILKNTIQAISISHRNIVRWAKENHLPEVCIAEDDILFTSKNSYEYFLQEKPEDYDIYLGGFYSGAVLEDGTMYSFCGLHLYSVHSRYFDTFLNTHPMRNIDAAQAGRGKFIACNPLVAKQRNGYSFHRKQIVDDEHRVAHLKFLTD